MSHSKPADSKPEFLLQLYAYSGVTQATLGSVILELARGKGGFSRIGNDALISRSRSRGASMYYDNESYGKGTAVVMVDHDIEWQPGAAEVIAKQAVELNTIVGGLYCKRAIGKGFASRLSGDPGKVTFGVKGVLDAEYVATGFMAIPWTVLDAIVKHGDLVERVDDGNIQYYTFFATEIVDHTKIDGAREFLSEDWAFCKRAKKCGYKSLVSTYPNLRHWGEYGFMLGDAFKDALGDKNEIESGQ